MMKRILWSALIAGLLLCNAAWAQSVGTNTVCTNPTVTTGNGYGTNFVVGGLLSFPGLFGPRNTGLLQNVTVQIKDLETSGFTLFTFDGKPSNTTWTDAAVAAIAAADKFSVRIPVALAASNALASTLQTALYASGLAIGASAVNGGGTYYAVLLTNATLTNNFAGASDVQVCLTALQDRNN